MMHDDKRWGSVCTTAAEFDNVRSAVSPIRKHQNTSVKFGPDKSGLVAAIASEKRTDNTA